MPQAARLLYAAKKARLGKNEKNVLVTSILANIIIGTVVRKVNSAVRQGWTGWSGIWARTEARKTLEARNSPDFEWRLTIYLEIVYFGELFKLWCG